MGSLPGGCCLHGNSQILGNSQAEVSMWLCGHGRVTHSQRHPGKEGMKVKIPGARARGQPGSSTGQGRRPGKDGSAFPGIGSSTAQFPKFLMWMPCSMGMGQGSPGSAGEGSSSTSRAAKVRDLRAQASPGCLCPNPRGFSRRKRGSRLGVGWEKGRAGKGMSENTGKVVGKDGN